MGHDTGGGTASSEDAREAAVADAATTGGEGTMGRHRELGRDIQLGKHQISRVGRVTTTDGVVRLAG